ncbi:unnamed protein product [Microthlaspi erraticum]|uniref:Uncharacterized protein n=1 Tax=Microthlaspi erraticum TaxID=1685480 RepID=A0A6D2HTL1_9BRAS|nr:unnamed protein product [Microthlaspi erraticum]
MAITEFVTKIRQFYSPIQAWIWLLLAVLSTVWSTKISSYPWTKAKLTVAVLAVIPSCAPQAPINIRHHLRQDVYCIVKTLCSLLFFNVFKLLADAMTVADDIWICAAAVCFFLYILAVDVKLGVEDDLGFLDGLLFAVYSTFLNDFLQKPADERRFFTSSGVRFPAWLLHCVFALLLLFKNLRAGVPDPADNLAIVVNEYRIAAAAPNTVVQRPAAVERRAAVERARNPKILRWALLGLYVVSTILMGRPSLW